MAVERAEALTPAADGHIVKLRYTPLQHTVRTVEEGPDAERLDACPGLAGMRWSPPSCIARWPPSPRGARRRAPRPRRLLDARHSRPALPLSRLVPRLKDAGLIGVITCGQAFGRPEASRCPRPWWPPKWWPRRRGDRPGPGQCRHRHPVGLLGIAQADWLHPPPRWRHTDRRRPHQLCRPAPAAPRPQSSPSPPRTLHPLPRPWRCRSCRPSRPTGLAANCSPPPQTPDRDL